MEQFLKVLPDNFRELFSIFAFIISLLFVFISLNKKKLEHGLRMASILFIVSLSLFANQGYCYFAAIFIIATGVTQLDFLQNIAAIIRGSKEYFDYKKEIKSTKEVEKDIEDEVNEIENTSVEEDIKIFEKDSKNINITINKQYLNPGQFGLLVEEYAFKYLEKLFQKPIQRYVRLHSKRYVGDFDGIMSNGDSDIIFEIKATRRGIFPISFIKETIFRMTSRISDYKSATKRDASLRLILVGNFETEFQNRILTKLPELISNDTNIGITIGFLSFSEIDLDIENKSKTE